MRNPTVKEITIRVTRHRVEEGSALYHVAERRCDSPGIVAGLFRTVVQDTDTEHFLVIPLDAKLNALGVEVVHRGTYESCTVDARSILRSAIVLGATSLVVAHNHPSGDAAPSGADLELTRKLHKATQAVGLDLLDHVVVADFDHHGIRESHPQLFPGGAL